MKHLNATHKVYGEYAASFGGDEAFLLDGGEFITADKLRQNKEVPVELDEDDKSIVTVDAAAFAQASRYVEHVLFLGAERAKLGPNAVQVVDDEDDRSGTGFVETSPTDSITLTADVMVGENLGHKVADNLYLLDSGQMYRAGADRVLDPASDTFEVSRADYTYAQVLAKNAKKMQDMGDTNGI
ncbi:MAG: hypothetical protein ACRC5T_03760 [Cetobacterium sp.]